MYNKERKEEYIEYHKAKFLDESKKDSGLAQRIFIQISDYEEMLDKDCCNFTVSEIITYYKSLYSKSLEYLLNVNSQLRKYTAWFQEKSLLSDNQNHYEEIDADILLKCVNTELNKIRMVTRKELLKKIEVIRNPCDQFVILGLFEGIGGPNFTEFFDIGENNFKDDSIVLNTGRVIPISQKLIDIGKESIKTYEYEIITEHTESKVQYRKFNENDKTVIKTPNRKTGIGDDSDPQLQHQRIYSKVMRMKKIHGEQAFTPNTLITSGLIEKIREVMKNKNLSIQKALKDEDVTKIYNKTINANLFALKYGNYIKSLEKD